MPDQTSSPPLDAPLDLKTRSQLIEIALAEYAYWRGVDDPRIESFSMGAMGAAANIVSALVTGQRDKTAHDDGQATRKISTDIVINAQDCLATLEMIISLSEYNPPSNQILHAQTAHMLRNVQKWIARTFLSLDPANLLYLLTRLRNIWDLGEPLSDSPYTLEELKTAKRDLDLRRATIAEKNLSVSICGQCGQDISGQDHRGKCKGRVEKC